jgi:hypothetical protein
LQAVGLNAALAVMLVSALRLPLHVGCSPPVHAPLDAVPVHGYGWALRASVRVLGHPVDSTGSSLGACCVVLRSLSGACAAARAAYWALRRAAWPGRAPAPATHPRPPFWVPSPFTLPLPTMLEASLAFKKHAKKGGGGVKRFGSEIGKVVENFFPENVLGFVMGKEGECATFV